MYPNRFSNEIDDMVESNTILYAKGEKPDHTVSCLVYHIVDVSNTLHAQVVVKYVPLTGDNMRAMDKYTSEICMGGHNIIVIHNTCKVSSLWKIRENINC